MASPRGRRDGGHHVRGQKFVLGLVPKLSGIIGRLHTDNLSFPCEFAWSFLRICCNTPDLPCALGYALRAHCFDHGVGHPLLLLCDAKAPKCRKNKMFKHLDCHAEWPKVADAVIKSPAAVQSPASPCCPRGEGVSDLLIPHQMATPNGRVPVWCG
jgi:hypothetical protein